MKDNFSVDGRWGEGFEMIQVHYIYLHFISIIITFQLHSDHQALDPRGWGPLGRE